jgi:hypothetical protein
MVCAMLPSVLSLCKALALLSVTHMLVPSKSTSLRLMNPAETVVTIVGLRVMIETDPLVLAVQIREPSKAIPKLDFIQFENA